MKLRKLLSLALVLMLTLSLAVPAFAATETPENQGWVTKTFVSNVEKEMTFSFTATQVTDDGTDDYMDATVACTIADIKLGTSADVVEYGKSQLSFGDFTAAGVYKYTVKETAQTASGQGESLDCSEAEYEVYVYVEEDNGTYSINTITVHQTKDQDGQPLTEDTKVTHNNPGDNAANGFNFYNVYVYEAGVGTDPSNPPETYTTNGSLTVSKTVEAADGTTKADENTEFAFTATFEFLHEDLGADSLGGIKADGTVITLSTTNTYTFKLKDGEDLTFTDIPVGTKVTIVETGVAKYKGSAEIVMDGTAQADVTATGYGVNLSTGEQTLGKNTNTVDVTNEHVYIPTTGVILNVLPFVLMLTLAVGALFVMTYFKRRRAA